jgi:DNA-binding CsgD family transcriptional regulator
MARAGAWGQSSLAEPLLEREDELAVLEGALDAAQAGRGTLVLVEGPAGIGKTRLVAAARNRALAAGMLALEARGLELERDTPFGVALQLLAPVLAGRDEPARAELFAGPARSAAPLFDGRAAGEDAVPDASAFVLGLYWLMCNVLRTATSDGDRPALFLCIDDAHWADRTSLRFLAQLAGQLDRLRLAIVLSTHPRNVDAPPELAALRGLGGSRTLRPRPLSTEAVQQLVAASFPRPHQLFVSACERVSGGNPLLLHELLLALRDEGREPSARTAARVSALVPESVQQSVLTRIGDLPRAARALATALAVLGDGTALTMAGSLADLDVADAEEAADMLVRAGVLSDEEPLRFRHPLIGTAVAADIAPFARSRAHRRAVELLREAGAPPERLAQHLLAVRPAGEREVVALLRAAAEHASRHGETSAAARLLERALEEPPPSDWHTDVIVDLALTGAAELDPTAARRLREALALLPVGDPRRARTQRALVKLHFAQGDFGAAVHAADEAVSELSDGDPVREELLVDYIAVGTFYAPARDRLADLLEPLLAAARAGQLPDSPARCGRLATRAGTAGETALVRSLASRALAAESLADDTTHGLVYAFAAASLTYVDELELAERKLTHALERARRLGSMSAWGIASQCRALVRVPQGKLAEAASDIEEAVALHAEGWEFYLGWSVPVLAHARIEQGDLAAAEAVLSRCPVDEPQSMEDAFIMDIAARLALEQGNPKRALALLTRAGGFLAKRFEIDHPCVLAWRPRAAIAALRAGRRQEAAELAELALQEGRASGVARLEGVALAAAGVVAGGEPGVELLQEAVDTLEHSPAALERCHALAQLGATMRRAGHPTRARQPLQRALELAEHFGARPLADFALGELHATGARPRRSATSGADALTPSELRVARLAAEGLSNGQIASQLYLTSKTVEWHLSHAYRKLGISSRAQLAEALHKQGSTDSPLAPA